MDNRTLPTFTSIGNVSAENKDNRYTLYNREYINSTYEELQEYWDKVARYGCSSKEDEYD